MHVLLLLVLEHTIVVMIIIAVAGIVEIIVGVAVVAAVGRQ